MELVTKDAILRCYYKQDLVSQIYMLGNDNVMSVSLVEVTMDEDEHEDFAWPYVAWRPSALALWQPD